MRTSQSADRSIWKFYKRSSLIPFVIIVITGITLALTHVQDSNYKSEYFASDGFTESVFFILGVSAAICIVSLTIYCNRFQTVANNQLLSGACSLLLPFLLIGNIMRTQLNSMQFFPDEVNILDYFIIGICIAHIIALTISFILFRQTRQSILIG